MCYPTRTTRVHTTVCDPIRCAARAAKVSLSGLGHTETNRLDRYANSHRILIVGSRPSKERPMAVIRRTRRASGDGRRRFLKLGVAVSAFLMASFAAAPAFADRLAHRGTQEEQAACTPDVFRLCSSFIPSESRIVACLMRSRAQLSPACGRVFGPPPRETRAKTATRKAAPRRTTATKRQPSSKKPTPRASQTRKAPRAKSPG